MSVNDRDRALITVFQKTSAGSHITIRLQQGAVLSGRMSGVYDDGLITIIDWNHNDGTSLGTFTTVHVSDVLTVTLLPDPKS